MKKPRESLNTFGSTSKTPGISVLIYFIDIFYVLILNIIFSSPANPGKISIYYTLMTILSIVFLNPGLVFAAFNPTYPI